MNGIGFVEKLSHLNRFFLPIYKKVFKIPKVKIIVDSSDLNLYVWWRWKNGGYLDLMVHLLMVEVSFTMAYKGWKKQHVWLLYIDYNLTTSRHGRII